MLNRDLKSLIRRELAAVTVTTDNKRFLNEHKALIHESGLEDKRQQQRSWESMKDKIARLVLEVLAENRWGIYFKSEPMQVLPVKDSSSTLFKVNEVNLDEFEQTIKSQIDKDAERSIECQENQAENTLQIDKESSTGIETMLNDTEE
tara:strand:+ start:299 stop:742 length:444 start_codon:yes stop_codon:yes gene_type:complete